MVVSASVICNKSAKIIIARTFQEMSRIQLEEQVILFSRNIDIKKQTTIIDSDKSRFIYIPVEGLYILLISSIDSNIIEDMETIKLIYRLVQDLCGGSINEYSLRDNANEIILGMDDIVAYGIRSGCNIAQVKQFLTMDSQEEKEFNRLKVERENQAKEQFRLRAMESSGGVSSGGIGGVGSSQYELSSPVNLSSYNDYAGKGEDVNEYVEHGNTKALNLRAKKGLKLGKKQEIKAETTKAIETKYQEELVEEDEPISSFNPLEEPVKVEVEEKIKGEINKDGEFKKLEVRGEGFLTINNPSKKQCEFKIKTDNKLILSKVNKKLFNENQIISPENPEEGFAPKSKLCIFKYTIKLTENDLPFTFNCFNSTSGKLNIVNLTIESNYNKHFSGLKRVEFHIKADSIHAIDANDSTAESSHNGVKWIVGNLEDGQPSLEIKTTEDIANLFPIDVVFEMDDLVGKIDVENAHTIKENEELIINVRKSCISAKNNFIIAYD